MHPSPSAVPDLCIMRFLLALPLPQQDTLGPGSGGVHMQGLSIHGHVAWAGSHVV